MKDQINRVILISIEKKELFDLVEQAVRFVVESNAKENNQTETIPKLISRERVLKIYSISAPTLRDWTKKGIVPQPIRKRRRLYFREKDVMDSLKKHK